MTGRENWVTPTEMAAVLQAEEDEDVSAEECKELMDEMVAEGIMREDKGEYQLAGLQEAAEFLAEHAEHLEDTDDD